VTDAPSSQLIATKLFAPLFADDVKYESIAEIESPC
jgi:hypothetical protein